MKIFNTKKLQEEWQKKVEDSYNQGKKDAENGFNNLLNAVTKDKEYWNSLSEKELLIEMMLALKLSNDNVENLNNKVTYIKNYKGIFKDINNNIDELKKTKDILNLNIENETKQIIEFKKLIKNVTLKINTIDSTLNEIINVKDNINKVIKDIDNNLPRLSEISSKIDEIANEIDNTIETYSDSPAEILNQLRETMDDIYSKIDSALSVYDSYSLYSKIEEL